MEVVIVVRIGELQEAVDVEICFYGADIIETVPKELRLVRAALLRKVDSE